MNRLDAEHFSNVKRLFLLAMREPPHKRAAVLREKCGSNALIQEVNRLLNRRQQARTFLRKSVVPAVVSFQGTARFDIKRMLGSGGFGEVYQAFDRHAQADVALKVLRQLGPSSLRRFKDEFRTLQGVSHPNLVQLYELIFDSDSGFWFFTMELIDGRPFLPEHPASELRAAMRDLALGIHALHSHGIVHCDIKPSNVLVTPGGRVVLLDFGLARRFTGGSSRRSLTLAGTPDYVAPEQISGAPVTAAADWYSAGVVLYQALTGRLPFEGNAWEVMARKQDREPDLMEPLPGQTELIELCRALLRRDPAARPAGEEVLRILGDGEQKSQVARSTQARFFGRTRELQILRETFDRAQAGDTVSCCVSGTSGIGKTALVLHFLESLSESNRDLLLLKGKCHEGEFVPYKALDEIVDCLSRFLNELPPAELDAIAPRNFPVLSKLFPVLDQTSAMVRIRRGMPEMVDSQGLRRFAFNVFRELLARISDRRPVVVFIDDLQWGDLDSTFLLQQLLDGPDTPRILFLFAWRREEAADNGTIQSLIAAIPRDRAHYIDLDRLSESDTRELARALITRAGSKEHIEDVVREAEGIPFLTHQLAQYVEEGNSPPRVEGAILLRVKRLAESARKILEAIAVAGAPISLAHAREVAGAEVDAQLARGALISQSLIRVRGPLGEICETYHDRVRESVIAGMEPEALRTCHERLAIALESHAPPEVVATHYRDAGRLSDAARFAQVGAEQAMSALAFERATRLYGWALEWTEGDAQLKSHLERRRGDALVGGGRGLEAARSYERAAAGAAPGDVLALRIRCAAELLRSGEVHEGLDKLRDLLVEHQLPYLEEPRKILARLIWERARVQIRGLKVRDRGHRKASARQRDRLDVCWAAAIGTGMVDPALTEIYCAIYLRLALDLGEPVRLTMALSAWASRLSYKDDGELKEARKLMRRAEEVYATSPQPYTRGFLAQMWAIIELLGGNWRESQNWAATALDIYRTQCTGVAWEISTAINFLFTSRSLRGCWAENRREIPPLAQEARERGDRYAEVSLRIMTSIYSSYLATDEPDEGEAMIDEWLAAWPHDRFDMQKLSALTAKVEFDLFRGNVERAWSRIETAWPETTRSGPMMLTMFRNFTEDQRARAALLLASTKQSARERRPLLAVAQKAARKLERCPAKYALGLALLLRAGLAGLVGRRAETKSLLERAEGELESADLIPYLAATRYRLAEMQEGGQAARTRRAAMEWMESQNVRRPECLVKILLPCV
jgi:serine/threonine protein kinase